MASVPDTNNKGSPYSQVELVVDIPDAASAEALRSSLTAIDSIKSISVKDDFRQFVVTSNLPVEELRQLMNERSGQRVVLMGFGSASKGQAGLEQVSSAVSAIQNCTGHSTVSGVVRFTENRPEGAAAHGDASGTSLIADGVIDGLKVNSRYCVAVHEFGDVSNEATSCGRVFEAPITKKVTNNSVIAPDATIAKCGDSLIAERELQVLNVEAILSDDVVAPDVPLCSAKVVSVFPSFRPHLRSFIGWLSRNRPSSQHRHLKRVRKQNQEDSLGAANSQTTNDHELEQCEMEILIEVGQNSSDFCELSEADRIAESRSLLEQAGIFDRIPQDQPAISAIRVIQVPSRESLTRMQLAFSSRYWPTDFHDRIDKEVEAGFTRIELDYFAKSLSIVLANRGSSGNAVAFCDPRTREILAVAGDNDRENHPLRHAVICGIDCIAQRQLELVKEKGSEETTSIHYLCNDMDAFVLREPCVMCAMALVHSRIGRVFFVEPNATRGGLFSRTKLHTLKALNHHFRVYRLHLNLNVT